MSKKILVIKDAKEFKARLNLATMESHCVVADVMDLLKDYEEDVIGFEAEVNTFAKIGKERVYYVPIPKELIQRIVHPDTDIQVFVLKPKKPEASDEKDVSHP